MVQKSTTIAYPTPGICTDQRADESGQQGLVNPNFRAYSVRTSTQPVGCTRLCRSQTCRPGRHDRPIHGILDTPHRVHEEAPTLRLRRSSLKERGRVKALVTSDLGCLRPRRTRQDRRRGQGSGGARPRSGRRALRLAPGSTNNMGGGDSSGAGPQKSEWVGGALVKAGIPAGGRPGWAAGHPYAAAGAA